MAITRIKNVGGGHTLADGTVIAPGETFEHEGDFKTLCESFPNKFERVSLADADAEGTATADGSNDVTTDFPTAAEADLRVLKDGRGWNVYDEGEEPLNGKPLFKKDVAVFIEEYLAD